MIPEGTSTMTKLADELPDLFLNWLPRQRWFAARGREISRVSIVASTTLLTGDPAADLMILAVQYINDRHSQHYQMLIVQRHGLSGEPCDGLIGVVGDSVAYD